PFDLVSAGLGACTVMTVRMYADYKKIPLEDVSARIVLEKETVALPDGSKETRSVFRRKLRLKGELGYAQRQRLLEIANRCPVHRAMTGKIEIPTEEEKQ